MKVYQCEMTMNEKLTMIDLKAKFVLRLAFIFS